MQAQRERPYSIPPEHELIHETNHHMAYVNDGRATH